MHQTYANISTFVDVSQGESGPTPYKKTYAFEGECLNKHHALYAHCPLRDSILIDIGIPGWLQRADALKLYELAYFSSQNILELGCNRGLSTSILAQAALDAGSKVTVHTNDIAQENIDATMKTLKERNLDTIVTGYTGDATELCQNFKNEGAEFGLVFIDHDHSYTSVREVCETLDYITAPGGFCLFHDYKDSRNFDETHPDYGVWQGVVDGLSKAEFCFYGMFGCSALFRKCAH